MILKTLHVIYSTARINRQELFFIPVAVVTLEPDPDGAAGGDLLGAGAGNSFSGRTGLLGKSRVNRFTVTILSRHDVDGFRVGTTEFDESTIIFTDHALAFPRVEGRETFAHATLDGAEILGAHVGHRRRK